MASSYIMWCNLPDVCICNESVAINTLLFNRLHVIFKAPPAFGARTVAVETITGSAQVHSFVTLYTSPKSHSNPFALVLLPHSTVPEPILPLQPQLRLSMSILLNFTIHWAVTGSRGQGGSSFRSDVETERKAYHFSEHWLWLVKYHVTRKHTKLTVFECGARGGPNSTKAKFSNTNLF